MNLIGKMLDNRYEIIEKIGNGGMATVYKAKCHVLNRYVAVKILRDEWKYKYNIKLTGYSQSNSRMKFFLALKAYVKKEETSQIHNLNLRT